MNIQNFDFAANQNAATHNYLDSRESENQAKDISITHNQGCEKIKFMLQLCEDFGNLQKESNHSPEPYKKLITEEDLQLLTDAANLLGELTMPF